MQLWPWLTDTASCSPNLSFATRDTTTDVEETARDWRNTIGDIGEPVDGETRSDRAGGLYGGEWTVGSVQGRGSRGDGHNGARRSIEPGSVLHESYATS